MKTFAIACAALLTGCLAATAQATSHPQRAARGRALRRPEPAERGGRGHPRRPDQDRCPQGLRPAPVRARCRWKSWPVCRSAPRMRRHEPSLTSTRRRCCVIGKSSFATRTSKPSPWYRGGRHAWLGLHGTAHSQLLGSRQGAVVPSTAPRHRSAGHAGRVDRVQFHAAAAASRLHDPGHRRSAGREAARSARRACRRPRHANRADRILRSIEHRADSRRAAQLDHRRSARTA